MNLWTTLDRAAALHPSEPALVEGERSQSYVETRDRAARLASFLRAQGVSVGDRVAVQAWNGIAFYEIYYAAAAIGAILVPLNVRLSAAEQAEVLCDCGARLLFSDADFAECMRTAAASAVRAPNRDRWPVETVVWMGRSPAPRTIEQYASEFDYEDAVETPGATHAFTPATVRHEDVAHLYYTSGTTGRSKGVPLTHGNVGMHALAAIGELSLGEADTWAHIAPMFHLADAWATFAITWAGGKHLFLPRFEALSALDLLEYRRATITNLVPTMLNLMVKHAESRTTSRPSPGTRVADESRDDVQKLGGALAGWVPRTAAGDASEQFHRPTAGEPGEQRHLAAAGETGEQRHRPTAGETGERRHRPTARVTGEERHWPTACHTPKEESMGGALSRPRDWTSLRMILSGGAPIAPDVVRAILDTFGCEYVQTYGMTETSPYLTLSLLKERLKSLPLDEQIAYRCKTGRPFATIELKVVDEQGVEVAADERAVGEIWVRGPTVTPGYWNRPDETAAAFQDDWLKTGDLAVIDAEGYVTIVDRKKDMIITGGEKVYSIEVEHALYAHPAVLECAVFGVPDEEWGESVRAAVVLRPGACATEAELCQACRALIAGYKVPRSITFIARLPKTGSGKIYKQGLRESLSSQARV